MTPEKLKDLNRVTDALYQKEFAAIRDLITREGQLRSRLHQLDQQVNEGKATLQDQPMMQLIGADILWQAWESRTRRGLHTELAQVLALKSHAMDKVRYAFGRNQATETLLKNAENQRKMRRLNRQP